LDNRGKMNIRTRMPGLPTAIYSASEIRRLEQKACELEALTEIDLMERAGLAAAETLLTCFPEARTVCVLVGKGNNGGDGYVLARHLQSRGLSVEVLLVFVPPDASKPTALQAYQACRAAGVRIHTFNPASSLTADVIVDAIFGIGLTSPVQAPVLAAIDAMNAAKCAGANILAIDIPSGIHADTGQVLGAAVQATITLTFIGLKRGLVTGAAVDYVGELQVNTLGLTEPVFQAVKPSATRLELEPLPRRHRDAHKGDFGHVLVVGGDYGMPGAVCLAARAALRVGAGWVTVATRPEHVPIVVASQPELMCHGIRESSELGPLLARATVVILGPGLGQSEWSTELFKAVLAAGLPCIVDASALQLLATAPQKHPDWIVTPHPGEAAALLGVSVAEVQQDRYAAVQTLQATYGGVAVLKGAGTLVQGPQAMPEVCTSGNPGMASAGMGDVLSGVCGGLLAQGLGLTDAALKGVLLHALAGDRAALQGGERGLVASDLFLPLREFVNPIPDRRI
jgi:hydroxyethylthiazole kinase-like uncharacterized protein yjeF